MDIAGFTEENSFLSNFFERPLRLEGLPQAAKSGEHAYQALKTTDEDEQRWILEAYSPTDARRRGFRVAIREDWDQGARTWAMLQVVMAKFEDKELEQKLYATEGPLINFNETCETFHGVCVCPKHGGQGRNMLGELLMMRRALRA